MNFDMTFRLVLPTCWAPFFFSGDESCLEEGDPSPGDLLEALGPVGQCVSMEEHGFRWKHDVSSVWPYGADCSEFIFVAIEE